MAEREGPHGAAGSRERGSASGTAARGRQEQTGPADEAVTAVKEVGEDLRRTTREKGRELRAEAERRVDEATSETGDRVASVARALERAGEELRSEGEGRLASLAEDAAEQVQRFGSYLEDESPERMLHDVERIARSNPALFLGGSFAVGLLAGRFLGSGERRDGRSERREHTPEPGPGAPPYAGAARPVGRTEGQRPAWSQGRAGPGARPTPGGSAAGRARPGSQEPRGGYGAPTPRRRRDEGDEEES